MVEIMNDWTPKPAGWVTVIKDGHEHIWRLVRHGQLVAEGRTAGTARDAAKAARLAWQRLATTTTRDDQ